MADKVEIYEAFSSGCISGEKIRTSYPKDMDKLDRSGDKIHQMRAFFLPAFQKHISLKRRIIDAPPAAGKTNYLSCLILSDQMDNPKTFSVISVPNTAAGTSYIAARKFAVPEFKESGKVKHNVQVFAASDFIKHNGIISGKKAWDEFYTSKAKQLLIMIEKFFKNPELTHTTHDRTAVLCDASFVRFFRIFKNKYFRKNRAFYDLVMSNLGFYKDEAQKCMVSVNGYVSEDDAVKSRRERSGNRLGYILRKLCHYETSIITLASATMYRHDRRFIYPEDQKIIFDEGTCKISLYDWFSHMLYFKNLNFGLAIGHTKEGAEQTDFKPALAKVLKVLHEKKDKRKGVIYLPKRKTIFATGTSESCKKNEVMGVCQKIREELDYTSISLSEGKDNGIIILERKDKYGNVIEKCRVLDLVTAENQQKAKNYLLNTKINEEPDALDYIIALEMFKEAGNWEYCDTAIIIGMRKSIGEVYQMCGRTLRDKEGKPTADIYQILHHDPLKTYDRVNINEWYTYLASVMVLADVFNPVSVCPRRLTKIKTARRASVETLWKILPMPEPAKRQFLAAAHKKLCILSMQIKEHAEEKGDGVFKPKDIYNAFMTKAGPEMLLELPESIQDLLVEREDKTEVLQNIYECAIRLDPKFKDIVARDIKDVADKWNMVTEICDPTWFVQQFASKTLNLKSMRELIDIIRREEIESNERCHELCKWIKDNGGKMPNKRNGGKEKELAGYLSRRRSAKAGKFCRFYLSDQIVAESYGYPDLFNTKNNEKHVNLKAKQMFDWMQANGNKEPSIYTEDPIEKLHAKFLAVRRQAYKGTSKAKGYQSTRLLAIEAGYADIFDEKFGELHSNARTLELVKFIKDEKYEPSKKSENPAEASLAYFLSGRRKAVKKGKGYDSDLKILAEHGMPTLFDVKGLEYRENVSNEYTVKICQKLNSGEKLNKIEMQWLNKKRIAYKCVLLGKPTSSSSKFYLSDIDLAIKNKQPDLFEQQNLEKESNIKTEKLHDWMDANPDKGTPRKRGGDEEEISHGTHLCLRRRANKYKNTKETTLNHYESDVQINIKRGRPNLFDGFDDRAASLQQTTAICIKLNNGERLTKKEKNFLAVKRQAKKNNINFYEDDFKEAIRLEQPSLFNIWDPKLDAIENMKGLIAWMNNNGGKPPRQSGSHNAEEKKWGKKLSHWKSARNNSSSKSIWYPILETMASEAGYVNLFRTTGKK